MTFYLEFNNQGFPGSSVVKESTCQCETQQMWVRSLSGEDPLEKEIATHASTLAWRILWTEEPLGYRPWGREESDTTYGLNNNETEQE